MNILIYIFLYIIFIEKNIINAIKNELIKLNNNILLNNFNAIKKEYQVKNNLYNNKKLIIKINKVNDSINNTTNNIKKGKVYNIKQFFHINNKFILKKKKLNEDLNFILKKKNIIQKYIYNFIVSLIYKYKNIKIITKIFLTSTLIITLLNLIWLKPEDIALHYQRIIRSFEFYRIFTSSLFYGDFSLYVLTNIYMLYIQSQQIENTLGSSETLSYYLSQILLLSIICSYFKKPFYSTAILKSMLFLNCMLYPHEKSNLIFGLNVYNIYLPYLSILIDILHAQNLKASLSGLFGITTGFIYYLSNIYLYEKYNKKFFTIPNFLKKKLDSLDVDNEIY